MYIPDMAVRPRGMRYPPDFARLCPTGGAASLATWDFLKASIDNTELIDGS